MKVQKGFTLIELIIVIVILGILAAFAIPRFYDFRSSAATAVLNSLVGSINSAIAISHGAALANNLTGSTGSITMDGQAVALVFGYPAATAAGIGAAVIIPTSGGTPITAAVSGSNYQYTVNGSANCTVTYGAATSAAVPPTVTVVNSGC